MKMTRRLMKDKMRVLYIVWGYGGLELWLRTGRNEPWEIDHVRHSKHFHDGNQHEETTSGSKVTFTMKFRPKLHIMTCMIAQMTSADQPKDMPDSKYPVLHSRHTESQPNSNTAVPNIRTMHMVFANLTAGTRPTPSNAMSAQCSSLFPFLPRRLKPLHMELPFLTKLSFPPPSASSLDE